MSGLGHLGCDVSVVRDGRFVLSDKVRDGRGGK